MKQKIIQALCCIFLLLLKTGSAYAQGVTNFGNMHLFSGGTMNTPLPFTNSAAGGTDYTNDGYFSLQGDFTNNKANMPAGTGTTEFNAGSTQNINGAAPAQFNHFLINNFSATGILPAAAFYVAGNWTNNGSFTHNNQLVLFNGSALQNLNGVNKTVFYDFSLQNNNSPISMQLIQQADLLHVFSFTNINNAVLDAGYRKLHIKSTAALTAQIADMTVNNTLSGNQITGEPLVERYIQSGRKWRFLSIPVSTMETVKSTWMEGAANIGQNPNPTYGTVVTDNNPGAVAAGFDAQSVSGPSVKYYNVGGTYTGIPSPNYTISFQRCYMNFVRGDRTAWPSNGTINSTTLRTSGFIKQGNISYPIASAAIDAIGNPYPSRIDFRKLNKTNLTDYIWLWDPLMAGGYGYGGFQTLQFDGMDYRIMPGGFSYGPAGSILDTAESGQGFFMQGNTGGGTVQFTEPAKISGSAVVNFAPGQPERIRAMLSIAADTVYTLLDGVQADFSAAYTNAFSLADGLKMENITEGVAIKNDGRMLVYKRHASIGDNDTIQLFLSALRNANYRWELIAQNLDEPGRTGFIGDRLTNTLTPISLSGSSFYPFSATAGNAATGSNRFYIVFKRAVVVPVTFTSVAANRLSDGNIKVTWKTENEINIHHYETERSGNGTVFTNITTPGIAPTNNSGGNAQYSIIDTRPLSADNFYRIRAVSLNGQTQYSNIVKVGPVANGNSISVFPNPIADHILAVHFENNIGKYNLQLFNGAGQLMLTAEKNITNANETISIPLQKEWAAGTYQLRLFDENGAKNVISIIVK